MSKRKFLVQGSIRGRAFGPFPIPVTTIATLEPGEAFDESTVLALQHMLLEQNPGAEMARVLGFSPLEEKAPVSQVVVQVNSPIVSAEETAALLDALRDNQVAYHRGGLLLGASSQRVEHPIEGWTGDELKLNSGCMLPPVSCPLLIELEPGVLVRASRPTFAESKGDQLVYETEHGLTIIGRPRWTY